MKEWLELGNGLVMLGTVAGAGVLVRLLLLCYYGRLYKECKRVETSRHKVIRYIREDLKRRGEKGQEIKNAATYTECRLAECKVLGIRIGWLENMLMYSSLFVLVCGVMTAFAGALLGCEDRTVLFLLFVSGVTVLGLLAADMILGLRDKYRRIRLLIRDYIENNWSVRAEWLEDNLMPEELAAMVVEKEEKPKRSKQKKQVIKDKPVKAESKKKGKAQEEKRRLTEELLRERRQLEARSFAEQRKKEQDVQVVAEQVQEEAAVTVSHCPEPAMPNSVCEAEQILRQKNEPEKKEAEFSYELLMREVLAEYLA